MSLILSSKGAKTAILQSSGAERGCAHRLGVAEGREGHPLGIREEQPGSTHSLCLLSSSSPAPQGEALLEPKLQLVDKQTEKKDPSLLGRSSLGLVDKKPIRPINILLTARGTKGLTLPSSNWAGVPGLGAQGLKDEKLSLIGNSRARPAGPTASGASSLTPADPPLEGLRWERGQRDQLPCGSPLCLPPSTGGWVGGWHRTGWGDVSTLWDTYPSSLPSPKPPGLGKGSVLALGSKSLLESFSVILPSLTEPLWSC